MKLVTFVHNGQTRLGALLATQDGERVFDLQQLEPRLPADMVAFLEAGPAARKTYHATGSRTTGTTDSGIRTRPASIHGWRGIRRPLSPVFTHVG